MSHPSDDREALNFVGCFLIPLAGVRKLVFPFEEWMFDAVAGRLSAGYEPANSTLTVRKSSNVGRIEGNTREDYYSHSR
jgi:hypothetical protein